MNINPLFVKRHSPRAFSENNISQEVLTTLFEAARWAPSSRNEQPWRFFYVTKENTATYPLYLSILNDWNQKWAQSAPVIIAAVAKTFSDHKHLPNGHAIYDLGQAVAYLSIQATEMDLFLHQMGGFDADLGKQVLELPEGYEVVTMIAVGYKGELNRIPADYHNMENAKRERLPLKSLVFQGNEKLK